MTMTIERPDRDVAELFGPPPARASWLRCTHISASGPRRKVCSTSPTAPSRPRLEPCCWWPHRPDWSGWLTRAKALTGCSANWPTR